MSSGPDDRGTATIKFSKDFDAPWYVAYGAPSELRRQIIDAFGYDEEAVTDVSLIDLMARASIDAQAAFSAAKIGTPDAWSTGKPVGEKAPAKRTTKAAAPKAEAKPEESPVQGLIDAINAATDETELKRVWAENQDAFSNTELQAAYKAKRNELKG